MLSYAIAFFLSGVMRKIIMFLEKRKCPSCGRKPPFLDAPAAKKDGDRWYKFVASDVICYNCKAKLEMVFLPRFYYLEILWVIIFCVVPFLWEVFGDKSISEIVPFGVIMCFFITGFLLASLTFQHSTKFELSKT